VAKGLRWVLTGLLVLGACFVSAVFVAGLWERHVEGPRRMGSLVCAMFLRQVGVLLHVYPMDHGGTFPSVIGEALAEEDAVLLRCPGEKAWSHLGSSGAGDEYVYVGAGMRTDAMMDPATTPLIFDKTAIHPKRTRNVLMASGEIIHLGEADFRRLTAEALARESYGEEAVRRLKELPPAM